MLVMVYFWDVKFYRDGILFENYLWWNLSYDREKVLGLVCVGCLRFGIDNVYLGRFGL